MAGLLNGVSVLGSFLFLFGLLFLIQRFTIGLIPVFKKQIWRLSVGDILFMISSFSFILAFVEIHGPY